MTGPRPGAPQWTRLTSGLLLAAAAGCAGAVRAPDAPGGFATRGSRLSDARVSRDLARLSGLWLAVVRAPTPTAAARYAHARAAMLLELARAAYERNDDGRLTTWLVDEALASVGRAGQGPTPAGPPGVARRHALWALLDSVASRRASDRSDAATATAVALEAALMRRESPVLGGPNCAAWDTTAERLAAALRQPAPVLFVADVPPALAPAAPAAPSALPAVATAVAAPVAAPTALPAPIRGVPAGVHFALDRATISPASAAILGRLTHFLREAPDVRVVLSGNTDVRGTAAYNLALSRRRADAVRAFLIARGVPPSRLTVEANAAAQLVARGAAVRDHAENRRVSLRYVDVAGREVPVADALDDLQLERGRAMRRDAH